MSLRPELGNSDEEEESDEGSDDHTQVPSAAQADTKSLSQVGALLSQVSEILQSATTGTMAPRRKVQQVKLRLKEISPKFAGGLINFELPVEMTRTLLKQVPDITPEFTKVSFKVQKTQPARTMEEMVETEKTMVEISKKLAGALTYLLSTSFPKDQKGHLPKNECIFRATCLTMSALHQLQIERHADGFIRRALATTTETEDVPDAILEMRKQLFFPPAAGGSDLASHMLDPPERPPEPRPIYPQIFFRGTEPYAGGGFSDRSRSRTPPQQRAENYKKWRIDSMDPRRKRFPPTGEPWGDPSPPGRGRRKY
jgi:hypothetical protein